MHQLWRVHGFAGEPSCACQARFHARAAGHAVLAFFGFGARLCHPCFARLHARLTAHAALWIALDLGPERQGFWVLAPHAAKRAPLEENHCANSGPVIQRVALDVGD